jgi:uncharacterized protein YndB with AHSA1/START domain
METQRTGGPRANALKHAFVVRAEARSRAPAEVVYDVLADVRSHLTWAGERQKQNTRLVEVEAPEGPASVGTEFATIGADPMGRFADRSVVTEARPPTLFEFVTEAHLETKKGKTADWTNTHRYELTATADGCRIAYTVTVTRISALPGMLAMFNSRLLSGLAKKAAGGVGRRGVRNLARMAEERAGA